ncbi:hypothetical protein HBI56_145100 [Parastagonospora nodorum]|uniref:Uncharacterized protein n=1 Tax=Phaeosphaeria nodorum (strain SN15 / ATCC MYA-4574 / FGSC 10173) TaxID=321614 RepID=A0A7U2F7W1_PHANO|nr:hypothetical protein HBH56_031930 [Parastagonospora nodorum]QRD00368.1 hypothetical protein JI435_305090 [Parastagonospora nodorum SN15]KAH3933978.1 hypothetical protein HBH54_067520 [Parastagonospora nodorum]KAH3952584.1 hypothetical protein HBH53_042530 [Parastagonospora nodorum]KAH4002141.1 hypothetical protein HBI10_084540 [Parastagonospora nodorum]
MKRMPTTLTSPATIRPSRFHHSSKKGYSLPLHSFLCESNSCGVITTIAPSGLELGLSPARTQGVLDSLKEWPHSEITSRNLRRRERR